MKTDRMIAAVALAVSLVSIGVSVRTELRCPVVPDAPRHWTAADESAVTQLMTKTPQQLGGYLATLRIGTARSQWTEAQVNEALRRMRVSRDWQAITNALRRVAPGTN